MEETDRQTAQVPGMLHAVRLRDVYGTEQVTSGKARKKEGEAVVL